MSKLTYKVLSIEELNDWYKESGNRFEGTDRDAILTMQFFFQMMEDFFEVNDNLLTEYDEFVKAKIH
ncbi:hypothetical protein OAA08_01040 [bacterium]|jgi:hypothetical protein|nr:hypothetical protein [bacterium]